MVAIAVATGSPADAPRERPGELARVAAWSAALVYALLMVGTYVRAEGAGLAFRDWPLMAGKLVPSLAPDGALAMFIHRALAVLATAVLIWVAVRVRTTAATSARTRRFATWSVVAVLAQIALGALNVLTQLAAAPRAAHVGVAGLLWASVVALAVDLRLGAPSTSVPEEDVPTTTLAAPFHDRVTSFVALTEAEDHHPAADHDGPGDAARRRGRAPRSGSSRRRS